MAIPVWKMVKDACENATETPITYKFIREYIHNKYGDVNDRTITCQTIVCTVNLPARIHYPENKKERICDGRYDFLFNIGKGKVEWYDPQKHGEWEIAKDENGKLSVRETRTVQPQPQENGDEENSEESYIFAYESQLRDFIARNLSLIDSDLQLYVTDDGVDGVEFRTDVGIIDILAMDQNSNLAVFELKLSRGTDKALGQIQRYMGWLTKHMADDKNVKGIMIAKSIDEKLKYAVAVANNIELYEYEMNFDIRPAEL